MNSIQASYSQLATLPRGSAPLSRGAKAAREFEANLIGSVLQSLEQTFASVPGKTDLPGADNYNYMGTQALAGALADRGGFGIAAMITHHLPHEGKGWDGDSSSAGPTAAR
jgi:Rod binding domain-containing protein